MEQTAADVKGAERVEQARLDFKVVTFTLAGKDYGIDIMKVKEISKASKFTFVPNAAPFVKGVYNLRGDIISVIDLRSFFNLPVPDPDASGNVNMIILRLEDHVIAAVVDTIDKVIGISSETVQPPHPLFGDINIKYISGVAENDGCLYVILDVERIFGSQEAEKTEPAPAAPAAMPSMELSEADSSVAATVNAVREDVDIGFIEETLITFSGFHSSPVNQEWVRQRFADWKEKRGENVQLGNKDDAEAYLSPFPSPCSGDFWNGEYMDRISGLLPSAHTGNFNVWNPGCGSGHESYSVACMVKRKLPKVHMRLMAHDNDLIHISTAPGLVLEKRDGLQVYDSYLVDSARGRQFGKELKDSILFEYHDITHDKTLPRLDFVVMRDTVSYLAPDRQVAIFEFLDEQMKSGGLLVLGTHEGPIDPNNWERVENDGVVAYKKR